MAYSPRLKDKYKADVVPALQKKYGYSSSMQVPKLKKICVNQGIGDAVSDKKLIESAVKEMTTITGQKAVATVSKKDISNFKLRKGVPIGVRVTLRGDTMYEFLDRLITIALPRVRDFRGMSAKSFDGRGNYSLGVKEQIVFPEIEYDKVDAIRGMDITITTNAKTNKEAFALLQAFNFPFKEKEVS